MLAQYLQDRLTQLKITPAEAARRCGMAGPMMHNLVKGNHQQPRRETMEKLSTGLQVPLVELYREVGIALPSPQGGPRGSAWMRVAESIGLDPDQEAWLASIEEDEPRRAAFEAAVKSQIDYGRSIG